LGGIGVFAFMFSLSGEDVSIDDGLPLLAHDLNWVMKMISVTLESLVGEKRMKIVKGNL